MNDLRKAAEMALEALDSDNPDIQLRAAIALRQALAEDALTPCKTDPQAPHGFDRNASHSADRYVCECEGWEPPKHEWVGLSESEVMHIWYENGFECMIYAKAIEAKLKEKNGFINAA